MTMQRIFGERRPKRRTGLSFILFAFTFLCVIGAASFVTLLGVRSGLIKSAAPQVQSMALNIGLLDTDGCVIDRFNQLDCHAGAEGTPLPLVLGQLREAQDNLKHEQALRIAAEEKAKAATDALKRIADGLQARNSLYSGAEPANPGQPYVMLPGDTVQPFSKRLTLVYRQAVDANKILLGSDLWHGDREMEFFKPYRATLTDAGESTEVELVVSPAPDWNVGDRSIRVELKPLEETVERD